MPTMNNLEFQEKFSLMNQWADTVRAELALFISDSPPDIIYHYTDINGLMGIVTSGCIRATHVNRLNDSSENKHGFDFVREHVRANMPSSSKPLIEKALLELQSVETYVTCYSTAKDLLSQWRNYTSNQVGYNLGFDTSQMVTLDEKIPPLESIIYEKKTAQVVLDHLIAKVDEFLNKHSFGEIEVGYLLGMVQSIFNTVACIIKHPKFAEEKEYRHFYQPGKTGLELTPSFRSGQYGLTPYVEISFLKTGTLPLKTITIGPCQDFDFEIKIIKLFLHKYGYEKVKVLKSEIPLRI